MSAVDEECWCETSDRRLINFCYQSMGMTDGKNFNCSFMKHLEQLNLVPEEESSGVLDDDGREMVGGKKGAGIICETFGFKKFRNSQTVIRKILSHNKDSN
jgi:hypothetical protein